MRWPSLFLLLLIPSAAAAQSPSTFDVAYLHPNGVLFPLFYYEDGSWAERPAAQLPDEWKLVMRSGVEWTMPRGPRALDGSGGYQTGLASRRIDGERPAGLAVSPATPVIGFDPVPEADAEALRLLDAMRVPFEGFEAQQVKRLVEEGAAMEEIDRVSFVAPGIPVGDADRSAAPLEVRTLWKSRTPVAGGDLYYLQLERSYEGPPCPGTAVLTAWVSEEPGGLSILEEHVTLGTCEGTGLEPTLEPLGVVTVEGDSFVVAQEAVGAASVLKLTPSGMEVVAAQGNENNTH